MPDFHALSVWTNVAIFACAAAVVWQAGTQLAYYADAISERTRVSKAFIGLILLGVATSLPEIVTTITGAPALHSLGAMWTRHSRRRMGAGTDR